MIWRQKACPKHLSAVYKLIGCVNPQQTNLHEHRCDTLKFRGCFLMAYGHHRRIYRQLHCVVISPPPFPKICVHPFVTVMTLLYLLLTAHISLNSFHITYSLLDNNNGQPITFISRYFFACSFIDSPVALRLFVYKYYIKKHSLTQDIHKFSSFPVSVLITGHHQAFFFIKSRIVIKTKI